MGAGAADGRTYASAVAAGQSEAPSKGDGVSASGDPSRSLAVRLYRAVVVVRAVWAPLIVILLALVVSEEDKESSSSLLIAAGIWIAVWMLFSAPVTVRAFRRMCASSTVGFALVDLAVLGALLYVWHWLWEVPTCSAEQSESCWTVEGRGQFDRLTWMLALAIPYAAVALYEFSRSGKSSPSTSPTSVSGWAEVDEYLRGTSTFGVPGAALTAATATFGRAAVSAGQRGEQLTADILAGLQVRRPGLKVFHGLPWPGMDEADVDHAVVLGNTVIFVDSKYWMPARYDMHRRGHLLRNGNEFEGGDLHFDDAVAAWKRVLPRETNVHGIVAIHASSQTGELSVPRGLHRRNGLQVIDARRLPEVMNQLIAQHEDLRIPRTIYTLMCQTGRMR